jgi:hypothetical protein
MIDNWEQSHIFNFTSAIRDRLDSPSLLFQSPPGFRIGVRGMLALKDFAVDASSRADCSFIVSAAWRQSLIKVFCHEIWLRREIKWHVFRDGSLCYEFDDRWKDGLTAVEQQNDTADTVTFAAFWCLNGCQKLLEKHLLAYRLNLADWQPQWEEWPHTFNKARQLYAREKRIRR